MSDWLGNEAENASLLPSGDQVTEVIDFKSKSIFS